MSDEDRRSIDNLILLCRNHHGAIDSDPKKYTVAKIKRIRLEHERRFSEVGDTLKRWVEESFFDNTKIYQVSIRFELPPPFRFEG